MKETGNTFLGTERYRDFKFEKSSTLNECHYDSLLELLDLKFKNGTTYRYTAISEETYDELIKAESAGKYFASYIKNKHSFKKLDHDTNEQKNVDD